MIQPTAPTLVPSVRTTPSPSGAGVEAGRFASSLALLIDAAQPSDVDPIAVSAEANEWHEAADSGNTLPEEVDPDAPEADPSLAWLSPLISPEPRPIAFDPPAASVAVNGPPIRLAVDPTAAASLPAMRTMPAIAANPLTPATPVMPTTPATTDSPATLATPPAPATPTTPPRDDAGRPTEHFDSPPAERSTSQGRSDSSIAALLKGLPATILPPRAAPAALPAQVAPIVGPLVHASGDGPEAVGTVPPPAAPDKGFSADIAPPADPAPEPARALASARSANGAPSPEQPVSPTSPITAEVFAGAVRASVADDEPVVLGRRIDEAAALPATSAPLDTKPVAVAPTGDARQPTLDLRQERWTHGIIDHIERLRDGIDAADTRIRLVPDALGSIDVSVRKEGDTLHVHFAAEQAATRTILQDAQPKLAEIAEQRGLKLGQAGVSGGGTGGDRQPPQPQPQQSHSPRPAPVRARATQSTNDRIA